MKTLTNSETGLAARFEQKAFEIADVLLESKYQSFSLFSGQTGEALFLMNLYRFSGVEKYFDRSFEMLDGLMDHVLSQGGYYTYCNGIAGFGWFLSHIREHDYVEIDGLEDILVGFDGYLMDFMEKDFKRSNLDFLHGASGLGWYYLKRKHAAGVDNFLQQLERLAETEADGSIKWPFFISELEPDHYNFGLAHGIPAQVNLLARIIKWQPDNERAKMLLEGAMKYLLKNITEPEPLKSYFAGSIKNGEITGYPSRMAWCYGDLGVACSMWLAGEAMSRPEWQDLARKMMEHSAPRKERDDTLLNDGALCHGTVGVATLFQRFADLTRSPLLKRTAEYWYATTLDMAHHSEGLAGYKSHKGQYGWVNDYGFLTGVSGIGLALLSYLDRDLSDWEEILLLPVGSN